MKAVRQAAAHWAACDNCPHRHAPEAPCPPVEVWLVMILCEDCEAGTNTYCWRHRPWEPR